MVRPVEEKQSQMATSPQVVTSPDGKLQIINHSSYFDRFWCHCIDGTAKYVSPEPNLYAEIKADYYDTNRELIDTEVEIIAFQESGKTRSFFIMYSGSRSGEIQYYQLSITAKKRAQP